MRTAELIALMHRLAPPALAEEWDNTGLLVGDPEDELHGPILLTIDLTLPVVVEAIEHSCGAVVAYHPPLFRPIRTLTPDAPKGRVLLSVVQAGIAVYSPHTALDAAEGGVADWLLDNASFDDPAAVHAGDRTALTPHARADRDATHKIVTFVPESSAERIRAALAGAGAGRIGEYSHCSFNIAGRGTFFGSDAAAPAVGRKGRLETADEVRVEMVVGTRRLPAVIAALRATHPYEEPAFDLYALAPRPDSGLGPGRCMTLDEPIDADALAVRVRRNLGVPIVKLARAGDGPVRRVGVCPGSGGSLTDAAIDAGCDAFITGEMTHHEVLAANDAGLSVLLAGHTNTERGYLPTLAARMKKLAPAAETLVSAADASPFQVVF